MGDVKKKRSFYLSDEDIAAIDRIKTENGLTTDTAAVRFALSLYEDGLETGNTTVDMIERYIKKQLADVKATLRVLDETAAIILDCQNTFMEDVSERGMPNIICIDEFEAVQVTQSREHYYKRLEHAKQKKDFKEVE